MNKQITLSMINDELAKAKTSKKEFLDKMEKLIPWNEFIGIIKPVYYRLNPQSSGKSSGIMI